jgi:hypothetical protein
MSFSNLLITQSFQEPKFSTDQNFSKSFLNVSIVSPFSTEVRNKWVSKQCKAEFYFATYYPSHLGSTSYRAFPAMHNLTRHESMVIKSIPIQIPTGRVAESPS